ncbi:YggT family protein [Candidatus Solincola tengchongensis]|uniref:YggT family protein n=1 Tax=Candidatus Solincola tengchongensis TaxID=2900693 RepID=UPI00257F1CB5|nr:YggT family protein [Candidatus Solincola tengchongensis]
MRLLGEVLWWALFVYMWLIICRVLISWLPVRWPRGLRPMVVLVYDLTEPVLSGLRRVIPAIPLRGGAALDASPFVAVCIIALLHWIISLLLR